MPPLEPPLYNANLDEMHAMPFVIYLKNVCIYARWKRLSQETPPMTHAGPRSAVGNMSGFRCVSDCRSRGREFDPGPVPYFRGD